MSGRNAGKNDRGGNYPKLRSSLAYGGGNGTRETEELPAAATKSRRAKLNKKGTDSLNLKAVAEVLALAGMNPAEEVIKVMQTSGALDPKTRAMVALSLLEYIQPKLKSIEHKGNVGVDPDAVAAQLKALLAKVGLRDN